MVSAERALLRRRLAACAAALLFAAGSALVRAEVAGPEHVPGHFTHYPQLSDFLRTLDDRPLSYVPACGTDQTISPDDFAQTFAPLPAAGADAKKPAVILTPQQTRHAAVGSLVERLRACDYKVSVFEFDTRTHPHDAVADFAFVVSCSATTPEFKTDAGVLASASDASAAIDGYRTLYERVSFCQSFLGQAYPPNNSRFLCKYGTLIGSLVGAAATIFGPRWKSSLSTTVATGAGVIALTPSLCSSSSSSSGNGGSSKGSTGSGQGQGTSKKS
jgi:hypothetical protein